jgi:hypothetical protein
MEFNSYFSGMENYPNYPINDQIPSVEAARKFANTHKKS